MKWRSYVWKISFLGNSREIATSRGGRKGVEGHRKWHIYQHLAHAWYFVGYIAFPHLEFPLLFIQTPQGRQGSGPPFLASRKGRAGGARGSSQDPQLDRAAPSLQPHSSEFKPFSPPHHGDAHKVLPRCGNRSTPPAGAMLQLITYKRIWAPPPWGWASKVVSVASTQEA